MDIERPKKNRFCYSYSLSLSSKHTFQDSVHDVWVYKLKLPDSLANWFLVRFCKREAQGGTWKEERRKDSSCFQLLSGMLQQQQQ